MLKNSKLQSRLMLSLLLLALYFSGLSSNAHAQNFDYDNPLIEIPVTNAQIKAYTGQTTVKFKTIGIDKNGLLYIYTQDGLADPNAKLITIDVSGSTPVFTTILTEAELLPHIDDPKPRVYDINIDNNGVIYLFEFTFPPNGQNDEILRIVPGSPATITRIHGQNGLSSAHLNEAEDTLVVTQLSVFGAPSNDMILIPTTGGSITTLVTEADVKSVTGAGSVHMLSDVLLNSSNNYLVWDESFNGGSDQFLEINSSSATVRIVIDTTALDGGGGGGVNSMAIDAVDTIFAWNEFPATGGSTNKKLIYFENNGAGPRHEITKATLASAMSNILGGSQSYDVPLFGFTARSTASESVLYSVDETSNNIVSFTFPLVTVLTNNVDYNNPVIGVAVTRAQIAAFTGQTTVRFHPIGIDNNGLLYIYTQNNVSDPNAQLISIDVSGASPVFTTIATEAEIVAQLDDPPTNIFEVLVDDNGVIYLFEFTFPNVGKFDEILRIVPGSPATITNIRAQRGLSGGHLNPAQDAIVMTQLDTFNAPNNDIYQMSTTGGAITTVVTDNAITAVTGAAKAGMLTTILLNNADNYVVWDDSFYGGSDQLLEINPSTTLINVIVDSTTVDGTPSGGGLESLAIDSNDTIFGWNEFPATGGSANKKLIYFENNGAGPRHEITKSEITTALVALLGGSQNFDVPLFSLTARSTTNESILYATDETNFNIITFTFPKVVVEAAAENWVLYE